MLSDFKKLMSARALFTLAVQMQAVLIGWQMYELTRDPLHIGLIGLAEAIPALSLALFAGYVVDRRRPLGIYRGVVTGSLLSGLVLLVSQNPAWNLSLSTRVTALFASSVITGMARGFSQPSMFALLPRIVPRAELSKANAWMTSVMMFARISGPALGGILFGWLGIEMAAAAVCVSLVFAIGALALIRANPGPQVREARSADLSLKEELLSGAKFVFSHPILLPALSVDMVSVLFGGVTALLPIYAAEILHVGAQGLGALRAAPALGAALTSISLTRFDIQKSAGRWLFSCIGGFGLCIVVFALSHDFGLSLAALGLSGAFDSVSMVIRSSAVQLVSPDGMRGRISAVNSIFIGSSNELGEFESGVLAKLIGTVNAALLGGVVCLFTVSVVAVLSPTLRRLDLEELARS